MRFLFAFVVAVVAGCQSFGEGRAVADVQSVTPSSKAIVVSSGLGGYAGSDVVSVTERNAEKSLASGKQAPRASVKWHPGHYVLIPLHEDLAKSSVIAELEKYPILRGVQKRYSWAVLEPFEGRYDFSLVKRDLEIVRRIGKRLVIQIQAKSAFDSDVMVPNYLRAEKYDGGIFHKRAGGYNLALWNNAVRDRAVALVHAMGVALNDDPALEAVNWDETAINVPSQPFPVGFGERRFIENLLAIDLAMKDAFPNTVVIQYANYPINQLPRIVEFMKNHGVGLGGPDVFLGDAGLLQGVYLRYPELSGVVPLAPAVQWENYNARYNHGPFAPQSIGEIYDFARNRLKANYIFWLRRQATRDDATDYWGRVVDFLTNKLEFRDPAGGLRSSCPSAYAQCVD